MLEGAALYRDIIEPNPPLIFWLYALPVWLANAIGWNEVITLKFSVIALIAAVLGIASSILRQSTLWQERPLRFSLLAGISGLLLFGPDSYVVFAQREHLMVVLFLPYLLLHLPSVRKEAFPRVFHFGIGSMAAAGLCLKPHFFLIWLTRLAYGAWQRRGLRGVFGVADSAIVVLAAAYAGAVCLWTPAYFDWVAKLSQVYFSYRSKGQGAADIVLWFAALALLACGLIVKFELLRKQPSLERADFVYLAWITAGAYVQALLQFKAWDYIAYPFASFGMIAVMMAIVRRAMRDFISFALLSWLFFPFTPTTDTRQDNGRSYYQAVSHTIEPFSQTKRLYFFNRYFVPSLFYGHHDRLVWSARFPMLQFLLQGIVESSPVGEMTSNGVQPGKEALQQWLWEIFAEDLRRIQPELIIYYHFPRDGETGFDFERWLKQDPKLAELLAQYESRPEVKGCEGRPDCVYRVVVRRGVQPSAH